MLGVLSAEQLKDFIYLIRTTLLDYDYRSVDNVIFFNHESLYCFLQELKCATGLSVGEVLDTIEPYIPLALTEHSISMLLDSMNTQNDIEIIERNFSKNARMDFINLLSIAREQEEWENILAVCEKIRKFKEISKETVLL